MKKNFLSIKVMGYREALEYVYCNSGNPENAKYAIISIQEPTNGYGLGLTFKKGGNCLSALNIEFSDCTPAIKIEGATLMNKKDAQIIHDFVENISENVDFLIIHCKEGKSRSVAVADALLFVKTGMKKSIYESEELSPNKYVYYNILESYGLENEYWKVWYEKEKKIFRTLDSPLPSKISAELLGKIQIHTK